MSHLNHFQYAFLRVTNKLPCIKLVEGLIIQWLPFDSGAFKTRMLKIHQTYHQDGFQG